MSSWLLWCPCPLPPPTHFVCSFIFDKQVFLCCCCFFYLLLAARHQYTCHVPFPSLSLSSSLFLTHACSLPLVCPIRALFLLVIKIFHSIFYLCRALSLPLALSYVWTKCERERGRVRAGSRLTGEESLLFRLHSLAPLLCPAIYLPSQRTTRFLIFFFPFFSFRMFSASGHRSTTPSSSFSTLSSCSEELHNFALSTSTALSLSFLLCCSLARLYVSSEHCSSLSELSFFALFALRVCLFALL